MGELESLFLLAKEENLSVTDLKGSYAGAMGFGQFIPSSYLAYAVDFDNDGRRDLINNPVDAIGSVANYLMRHGWDKTYGVATAVSNAASNVKKMESAMSLKKQALNWWNKACKAFPLNGHSSR